MPRGKRAPRRTQTRENSSGGELYTPIDKDKHRKEQKEHVHKWVAKHLTSWLAKDLTSDIVQEILYSSTISEPGVIHHMLDNSREVFGNEHGYKWRENYSDALLSDVHLAAKDLGAILEDLNKVASRVGPAIDELHKRAALSSNL